MLPWPKKIIDPKAEADLVRKARHGVIICSSGELPRLVARPWPRPTTIDMACLWGPLWHRFDARDRCWIYYKQPLFHNRFLAIEYAVSGHGATLATLGRALAMLDTIAEIKECDAIVCQIWNRRLTPRAMARHGWSRHTSDRHGRNYIKRFYGDYSTAQAR